MDREGGILTRDYIDRLHRLPTLYICLRLFGVI